MEQEEIKWRDNSEDFGVQRCYDEEYYVSSLERKSIHVKVLNSPFSQDPVYVCSSEDFWNQVEALTNDSFEDISEQLRRDDAEPEDRPCPFEEDYF